MNKQLGPEYVNTSISTGTHIITDLLDAADEYLSDELKNDVDLALASISQLNAIADSYPKQAEKILAIVDELEEYIHYLWHEDIFDHMNKIAPEDCCFGTHPGDGADFGFWSNLDSDI